MSVQKVATRYAQSLMDLAEEQSILEEVCKDMKLLNNTVSSNRELQMALKSPIINQEKKRNILTGVFGTHFNKLSLGFFDLVLKKKREAMVPEIANAFIDLYRKKKRIISAVVTTAVPISEQALVEQLKSLVKAKTDCSAVEIEQKVDPAVMGGFVLEFEQQVYDSSVASKLENLRKHFIDNSYTKN